MTTRPLPHPAPAPSRLALLAPALLAALLAGCSKPPATPPVDATAPDAAASAAIEARVSAAPPSPAPTAAAAPAAGPAGAADPVPVGGSLDLPRKLRAIGTEPFWSADVVGATLTYGTPDFPAGMSITVARRDGPGFAEWSGALDGKPLTLRVEKGPCSDGMSDRIYQFRATRTIGPETEQGCARAR
ncbi:COG3650 family protein [Novosphingobium huizhouense]|uniref:COG3650 family protein n=1 Tax=Novosphingobium huizhouense TaxID=2866625 RepID=UPI001CD82476|nr:hypothetical protein [Novosphingobium huizhouense]